MKNDKQSLQQIMDLARATSVLLLLVHLYWVCYSALEAFGLTYSMFDALLLKFDRGTPIFQMPLLAKALVLVFLLLSCWGARNVKSEEIKPRIISQYGELGLILFLFNGFLLSLPLGAKLTALLYTFTCMAGYLLLLKAGSLLSRLFNNDLMKDIFNEENESFLQEERLIENEYSVNIPTEYIYKGKKRFGFINVVNPFRASGVIGLQGSGKTFAIINNYIRQLIEKGFAMYVYDFKFDDLSKLVYNTLRLNMHKYDVPPKFYVINFDDPRKSHRCNPLLPELMTDILDAYESSSAIMLNLNKKWIEKKGEFFVESPINFFAAVIWFLRTYKDGVYCTFPHAVEFLMRRYEEIFPILMANPEVSNYTTPFASALEKGAMEQLEGQIASARIPLSRLSSPKLYWVMSGNDFSLDINNPKEPKILCVGNNTDRQEIYGAALGLYNARMIKLINRKHKLKCAMIVDEFPTVYFQGLNNLLATARSNKVAVLLGIQDYPQLVLEYGRALSDVTKALLSGNLFCGQVAIETAEVISKRFGQILQKRQSISINQENTSTSFSTQLGSMVPASKIANQSQGRFVGGITDNFGEEISQKAFNATVIVDMKRIKKEEANYEEIPEITNFKDSDGIDRMEEIVKDNYLHIKADISHLIEEELNRISSDPQLAHLIPVEDE